MCTREKRGKTVSHRIDPALVRVHRSGPSQLNGQSPPDWRELQRRLEVRSTITVSVIVPNRNYGGKLLTACLRSAVRSARASGFSHEILVIDDCSTDDSKSVVASFGHEGVEFIPLCTPNSNFHYGPSVVRNVGVSLARGHYVIFVDSDDVVDKHYVGHYVKILLSKGVEHVTGAHWRFYPPPREDKRVPTFHAPDERLASIAAYPRAVPLVLGGWSPHARRLEDVEFNERFDAAGYSHARYEVALYWWRRYRSPAKVLYHDDDAYWRDQIARGRAEGGQFPIVRSPLLDRRKMPHKSVDKVLEACGAQLRPVPLLVTSTPADGGGTRVAP